jgi:hypothetical protein
LDQWSAQRRALDAETRKKCTNNQAKSKRTTLVPDECATDALVGNEMYKNIHLNSKTPVAYAANEKENFQRCLEFRIIQFSQREMNVLKLFPGNKTTLRVWQGLCKGFRSETHFLLFIKFEIYTQ